MEQLGVNDSNAVVLDPDTVGDDGDANGTDVAADVAWAYSSPAVVFVAVALGLVTVVTALGNLLVGLALVRYRRLRTMSNCLIGNLAVSDFLLAVTVLPLSAAYECLGHWVFGRPACKAWLIVDVLYCTASIWNLCVIAADRFTATMYPLWYRDRRSPTRAVAYVGVVWAVASATCVPPLIGWTAEDNYIYVNETSTYQCMPFQTVGYVIYSAATSFFVPFFVTCVLYAWIFVVLRRRMRAMRARRRSEVSSVATVSSSAETAAAGQTSAGCGSGSGRSRWTLRPWTRFRRKCRRSPTRGGGGGPTSRLTTAQHTTTTTSDPLELDDSSQAKSAFVTEYSDEKSSLADTEAELGSASPEIEISRVSSWRARLRFSSVRRPFQDRRCDQTNGVNRSRFRFTISGRHGDLRPEVDSSPPTPIPKQEVWTLSSVEKIGVDGGGGSLVPPPLTTTTTNCFRSQSTASRTSNNVVRFDNSLTVGALPPCRRRMSDVRTASGALQSLTNGNHRAPSGGGGGVKPTDCRRSKLALPPGAIPARRHSSVVGGIENRLPVNDSTSSSPLPLPVPPATAGNDVTPVDVGGSTSSPNGCETTAIVSRHDGGGDAGVVSATSNWKSASSIVGGRRWSKAAITNAIRKKSSSSKAQMNQQAKQRDRSERREMRATIRMAAIIAVFGAMWIGFFVVYVANGVTGGSFQIPPALNAFLFWLGYANSTVNPILYAVFNVDFRRAFGRIIADCCCCCRSAAAGARSRGGAARRVSSRRRRRR